MNNLFNDVSDCIEATSIALEKANLLIGDLLIEYDFSERPKADLNTANEEAVAWLWEHNRIITFMHMVQDYIFEASQQLEIAEQLPNTQNTLDTKAVKAGDVA